MKSLIVSLGSCLLVGISGSLATASSIRDWYPFIEKPTWTPPDALFGPVWTVLYIMMGVSAWLVWRASTGTTRRTALLIFALQLGLNSLWSFIFFGFQQPGWAALEIVALWGAIVATMISFRRIRPMAAWLLLPYLLWVSFATALNISIWVLNR
ncbi:MAG: tryptophan-rich sensory protein [Acidobacteriota bacterium]|nr:tryptophan-rich sensory protein [Acidobacteriota bacterium]